MARHPITVIKKQRVRPGPPCPLGGPAGAAGQRARARLVEQGPEGAVIEVVCGCGERIVLECSLDASAGGDVAAGADNETP